MAHPSRLRRLRAPLLVGAGAAASAVALHLRDPHVQGSWGGCPWLALTGYYCPGCGILRAVHDLTNVDVAAAASSNLVFVLAVPFLVLMWVRWMGRVWTEEATSVTVGREAHQSALVARHPAVLVTAAAAVMVTFAVLRNLPGSWLAP